MYYDSNTDEYSIQLGKIDCTNGIACGYFDDTLNSTGWGVLEIKIDYSSSKSKTSATDYNRMYAAGMLEGYLSYYEIYYGWLAGWQGYGPTFEPVLNEMKNWTKTQRQWIDDMIEANGESSQYWTYVNLLTAQFDGEIVGYNQATVDFSNETNIPQLTDFDFQFISGNQDLYDLMNVLSDDYKKKCQTVDKMLENGEFNNYQEYINYIRKYLDKRRPIKGLRCSAIVKVTPELDDIFFSHSTWSEYVKSTLYIFFGLFFATVIYVVLVVCVLFLIHDTPTVLDESSV